MTARPQKKHLKPHAISVIDSMSSADRELLDHWFLEENLSYETIANRIRKKCGRAPANRSLVNYHRRLRQKQNIAELLRSAQYAEEFIKQLTANPAKVAKAIEQIVAQMAFNTALLNADNPDPNFDALHHVTDLYYSARKDDREAGKFNLEREKWEFDVARMCFDHHAELQKISADKSLDEDARLLAIRRRLFGPNVPL